MTFPHYFQIFGHRLHPHPVMELIGYTGGFQLYLRARRKHPTESIPFEQNMWLIVGCIFGALIGSKLLAWVESAPDYWQHRHELAAWVGGKTIVGGLLGGWGGVEIAKKFLGITRSTGDQFVYPLIFGQCVGRVGCFLTGLDDHTHGNFTGLPWAVNFGDGPRHPTQLYEIVFLILLGLTIYLVERRSPPRPAGARFRLYLLGYLLFRFCVEFIKPTFRPYLGLSAIQLVSLVGATVCLMQLLYPRISHASPSSTDLVPSSGTPGEG
jgi:phosphatidylglycerol:prolipoprotein diacylglycerol transferase